MPKYYFHIRTPNTWEEDPEGAEFPTLGHAYDEAVQAAREIIAEKVLSAEVIDGHRFEITGEDGSVLRELPFRSVLRLE